MALKRKIKMHEEIHQYKVQKQQVHNTNLFKILNKKERIFWKKILRKIETSSLIKKLYVNAEICMVITDYSFGTMLPCMSCNEANSFILSQNKTVSIRCVGSKCVKHLLHRRCYYCKDYTLSDDSNDILSVYFCPVCRKKVCPINCVTKCVNQCQNKEWLCIKCVDYVSIFDSFKSGKCEQCCKWLCGVCFTRSKSKKCKQCRKK